MKKTNDMFVEEVVCEMVFRLGGNKGNLSFQFAQSHESVV